MTGWYLSVALYLLGVVIVAAVDRAMNDPDTRGRWTLIFVWLTNIFWPVAAVFLVVAWICGLLVGCFLKLRELRRLRKEMTDDAP